MQQGRRPGSTRVQHCDVSAGKGGRVCTAVQGCCHAAGWGAQVARGARTEQLGASQVAQGNHSPPSAPPAHRRPAVLEPGTLEAPHIPYWGRPPAADLAPRSWARRNGKGRLGAGTSE